MKRIILVFVFLCTMSMVIVSCRESKSEEREPETSELQEEINGNAADEAVKEAARIEKEAEEAVKEAEQAVEKAGEEVKKSLDKAEAVKQENKEVETNDPQQS